MRDFKFEYEYKSGSEVRYRRKRWSRNWFIAGLVRLGDMALLLGAISFILSIPAWLDGRIDGSLLLIYLGISFINIFLFAFSTKGSRMVYKGEVLR